MGIWRVLSGTILCDGCDKLLAHIKFDAADEVNIERVRVLCVECKEQSSKGELDG